MRRMFSLKQLEEISKQTIENASSLAVFEVIADKDGHKRFIEGDININELTGVSKTYGKWALSGTHLLIVLGLDFANGTTLTGNRIATIDLPAWIKDKIVPLWDVNIARISSQYFADDGTAQTNYSYLLKESNEIKIMLGTLTLDKARHGRIAFDLLIDNE